MSLYRMAPKVQTHLQRIRRIENENVTANGALKSFDRIILEFDDLKPYAVFFHGVTACHRWRTKVESERDCLTYRGTVTPIKSRECRFQERSAMPTQNCRNRCLSPCALAGGTLRLFLVSEKIGTEGGVCRIPVLSSAWRWELTTTTYRNHSVLAN